MSSVSFFGKYILVTCVTLWITGCVYTGSEFKPQSPGFSNTAGRSKISGNVLLTQQTSLNQPYCVIGEVDAYAHKISVFAPKPTREDVNMELQKKAAAVGADAVIDVQYASGSTIFPLSEQGEMRAAGRAVVVIARNQQCPR